MEQLLQLEGASQWRATEPLAGWTERLPEDDHPEGHQAGQGQCPSVQGRGGLCSIFLITKICLTINSQNKLKMTVLVDFKGVRKDVSFGKAGLNLTVLEKTGVGTLFSMVSHLTNI